MAVEKMLMMNLVGAQEDEDKILKQIILMGNIHLQTDLSDIYENHFALHVLEETLNDSDHNKSEEIREKEYNNNDYSDISRKIEYISKVLEIDSMSDLSYIDENFDYYICKSKVYEMYNEIHPIYEEINQKRAIIKKYEDFKKNIKYILEQNINFDQLNELHFFKYKIGLLSHKNKIKIIKNYENITAIVKTIGAGDNSEVFFIIYPQEYEVETERILKSVNFEEILIPEGLSGTLEEMNDQMEKILNNIEIETTILFQKLIASKRKYKNSLHQLVAEFNIIQKVEKIKEKIERENNVFILSGWVPKNQKDEIKRQISKASDKFITVFRDTDEIGENLTPPTKLKNPKWFKPFENLVKMYGIPSYDELDPTMFLSISYLIMFGAMFGDVGQGLIFLIFGTLLGKKSMDTFFGPILARLGISSIFFGFLYGSIFGNEEIIPWGIHNIFGEESLLSKIIINPMENMNLILILAVLMGIILIIISFGYSIVNSLRIKDIKEGLFGRNGATGLVFYIALLLLIGDIAFQISIVSRGILILLMIIAIFLIIIREPLANRIQHKLPLYDGEISGYYVESGFNIIETILSLASNTISFIRVGAFALNHVGLFLAFKTMATMANGGIGGILIMILGNIVIIGLEGLIVFIQGLRLQYYELFGKYFRGEGIEFRPIRFTD